MRSTTLTAWLADQTPHGIALKSRTEDPGYNIRRENVAIPISVAVPSFIIFRDASGIVVWSAGDVDSILRPSYQDTPLVGTQALVSFETSVAADQTTRRHTTEDLRPWEPVKWQTAENSVLFRTEFDNADRTED
jgi:hypothetical protein